MPMPTPAEVHRARVAAELVKKRLQSDPAFVQQLVQDPRSTLESAGVPSAAIAELTGDPR